jgi:RimJ/RimL family protein N-acetyltransferase
VERFGTERLSALPLRADDFQELCLMHRDADVMKYVGGVRDEEETARWLRDNLEHWDRHGFGCWMFRDRSNGTFVGRAGLRRVQVENVDEVELAYTLVSQCWRMGLATEMAKALVAIGFEQLAQENLIALVDRPNIVSRRVAEKVGFYFERDAMWRSQLAMLFRLDRTLWARRPEGPA